MSDTATDFDALIARYADADDGSGVGGTGWINPADGRALIRSLAREWARTTTVPTFTGTGTVPLVPGGAPTASDGLEGTRTANDFVAVTAGAPTRVGSISVLITFNAAPTAEITVELLAAGAVVARAPVADAASGIPASVSLHAVGVALAAGDKINVNIVGNPAGATTVTTFRLGVEASVPAT